LRHIAHIAGCHNADVDMNAANARAGDVVVINGRIVLNSL
jgi:hypothetical protein